MLYNLSFENILNLLPVFIAPIAFGIVVVVVVVTVIKRAKAEDERRKNNEQNAPYAFTLDGNGRTTAQNDYLAAKRRELAEKKLKQADNAHGHKGSKAEKYDKIVGSLGEVNDEGCDDLDGVRLIEHDEAYCNDPDHVISTEPTDLQRAIVVGEVLNTPRYKQMYRRK